MRTHRRWAETAVEYTYPPYRVRTHRRWAETAVEYTYPLYRVRTHRLSLIHI